MGSVSSSSLAPVARRIPSLDGLRGLAILAVIVFHAALGLDIERARDPVERVYLQIARAGWTGVDLFFVLSGFLITGILWDLRFKRSRYYRFYVRRVLRIFPLYYASLILLVAALELLHKSLPIEEVFWYFFHLQNWVTALSGRLPECPISHLWSLAIEEQFYLLWPIVLYSCGLRATRTICLVTLILSPLLRIAALNCGASPVFVHFSTITRLDGLAIGCLLAVQVARNGWPVNDNRRFLLLLLLGVAGIAGIWFATGSLDAGTRPMQTVGYSLLALFFVALLRLSLTVERGLGAGILRSRAMGLVGRISYAMYIFHLPLIWLLAKRWNRDWTLLGTHVANRITFLFVVFGLSFVLAFLSYHLYEKHFLRLANFLAPSPRRPPLTGATDPHGGPVVDKVAPEVTRLTR